MSKNVVIKIVLLLALISINTYASGVIVGKPTINKVFNYKGTWYLRYQDVKLEEGTKEKVVVNGLIDRVVQSGRNEERGFPLMESYDLTLCNELHIDIYNEHKKIVSQSNVFKFGDLTKCTDVPSSNSTKPMITNIFNYKNRWYIRYEDTHVAFDNAYEEMVVNGTVDRVIQNGQNEERGFPLSQSYDETACNEGQIKIYDGLNNVVVESEIFKFGDLTKCASSSTPLMDNYENYQSGIISANRLSKYIDNWSENRPQGVTGRLVIIQAGATSNGKVLKNDGENVLTYKIPAGGACDPSYMRHDGVANIPGAMVNGMRIDGMINTFHLNPEKDFIVFAVGVGSTKMRDVIRSLWSLNYWGWSHDRLAFLNGSVDYDFSVSSGLNNYLVDTASTPPATPSTYSMKSLKNDRTNLHIYINEMMKIAALDDKNGYFIADARGTSEYSGAKKSKAASKNCGENHDKQCYSPYQGHIRDAVDFPYTDLLILDDQSEDVNGDGNISKDDASFKFKSPSALEALYAQKGYRKGDKVITYCRTGRKATLIAFTSDMVLNYDVAMYDGSWIQWGEMANREDLNGTTILPAESKWITDNPDYSVNLGYTSPVDTQSVDSYEINNSATSSQQVKLEDQAYLNQ